MEFNLFKKKENGNLIDNFLKYYIEKTKNIIPYSERLPKWKKIITKKGDDIPKITLEQLANSKNVVVITGAGISVASNLPTFRGEGSSIKIPSLLEIKKNPKKFLKQYAEFKDSLKYCEPNKAHYAIKELEDYYLSLGRNFTLITQNVDGLHQKAGSENVIELHGNIFEYKCLKENKILLEDEINFKKEIPYCACGGFVRPNIIFFGEKIDKNKLNNIFKVAYNADSSILIGTSGFVEPINILAPIMYNKGVYNVEINPKGSLNSAYVFNLIEKNAEEALPELVRNIKNG